MSNEKPFDLVEIHNRLELLEGKLRHTIEKSCLNVVRQLENFQQLHSLIGDIPADLHGWPLSADVSLFLVRLVLQNRYSFIVEFGSGTSTYILLEALAKSSLRPSHASNSPIMLVYEHLSEYFQKTSILVEHCTSRKHCVLSLSPLESWSDATGNYFYYSKTDQIRTFATVLKRKRKFPLKKVLVLVDGPPGATGRWARYPALPIILDSLNGCRVSVDLVLDDTLRKDEQEVIAAWIDILKVHGFDYTLSTLPFEKGAALLSFSTFQ
ncbi:hypothetical protein [Cyanobium gracile]|uniref:Class I SAM-dependent methyltransferase n=1 Tax=Cyanobium gracile UHCC 0281 TaxID=3110309 RepID=A0ABU5SXM3_9CYAN|nr:hypothetical protein [Cyanobium gracile]MEA5443271.1 hypothetical protein [Cyanobium gracile UHCC 0281]